MVYQHRAEDELTQLPHFSKLTSDKKGLSDFLVTILKLLKRRQAAPCPHDFAPALAFPTLPATRGRFHAVPEGSRFNCRFLGSRGSPSSRVLRGLCSAPAGRPIRVDPMEALRYE